MNERVKELRKYLKLSQEQFGSKIGVGKSAISYIESGRSNLTEQTALSICREYNVDYLWLTTGEGEMFCNSDMDVMARIDYIMTGEDFFAKETFKRFSRLDDEDWLDLERIMNKLLDK